MAYSAERAATYAYQGHAKPLSNPDESESFKLIEKEEWGHRTVIYSMMCDHDVKVSEYLEIKFACIGKLISIICYFIGWLLPWLLPCILQVVWKVAM